MLCGEEHVITSPAVLSAYRSDGVRRHGPLPLAAILPGSASEVGGVVSACAAYGVPYVVRGAGTSRSGGALPVAGGVLIVLSRLRRVVSVSAGELTVEPGVALAALPLPPAGSWLDTTETLGTIGGHIAETRGIRNLVAIELVREDGRRLRLDHPTPGYDVLGAFPGSRGRAGIAVSLTLRVVPQP